MKLIVCIALGACSTPDASTTVNDAPTSDVDASDKLSLPPALQPGDFAHALDKPFIRMLQTWIDNPGFETKWTTMITGTIEFLGGADSAYHADLATLSTPLPGDQVLCHGDAKFDNFGWTLVDGNGVFSDNDFDDAGQCPVAADVLHFLLSTDLFFSDPSLDAAALKAYVDAVASQADVVPIDVTTEPLWDEVRTTGLANTTHHGALILGGEVQAATNGEVDAVRALVSGDARFPTSLLDVAHDVNTTGGSAGLRRFWLLVEDAQHPRTILELKELATPGTEFGPHSTTYDGPNRFDVLKPFWWNAASPNDHFTVYLLNGRFVVRDRYTRTNPKPSKLTPTQISNTIRAEAGLLASKHRDAWHHVDTAELSAWLHDSAATLTARWRAAYTAGGGT